jgi:hypothetical protein
MIDVASLNDIDRRMVKEPLLVARRLQQRMQLAGETRAGCLRRADHCTPSETAAPR